MTEIVVKIGTWFLDAYACSRDKLVIIKDIQLLKFCVITI